MVIKNLPIRSDEPPSFPRLCHTLPIRKSPSRQKVRVVNLINRPIKKRKLKKKCDHHTLTWTSWFDYERRCYGFAPWNCQKKSIPSRQSIFNILLFEKSQRPSCCSINLSPLIIFNVCGGLTPIIQTFIWLWATPLKGIISNLESID